MKKINFVSRYYYPDSPGGCEKVFYEVYKRALKEYKIKIITGFFNKNKMPENNSVFRALNFKNKILQYAYYTINMSLRSLKNNPSLIHANNIECLRFSRKPFILSVHHVGHFIHDSVRKQTLFNKLLKKLLVWQANRADKVITVSENTRTELESIGVMKDKIITIPNGVDLKVFKPLKNKKNKKFIISHVSRISPEKAQHFTINSFKKIKKELKDVELRIIGKVSDENYFKVLEKNDWIKYYTNLDEESFVKRLRESDLVVFPTMMSEGFGLVVLEAMACGVPVIASDQKSIREAGGRVCQYFKQGSSEDFIKSVLKLAKNSKLRIELSRKGLERVKMFSWDAVYEKYKIVYEELLK